MMNRVIVSGSRAARRSLSRSTLNTTSRMGVAAVGTRSIFTGARAKASPATGAFLLAVGGVAAGVSFAAAKAETNWADVKQEIIDLLENSEYDDGSYGPLLVRLGWHAAGTYCQFSKSGGSTGATMRFSPESCHGANAGLDLARNLLEPIKKKHPEISYADLWSFAACVAIEEMGGPAITWRPGRVDAASSKECTPDGRLPDAARGEDHVRAIFYRMGFSDREIVALNGAHAMGRCHTSRSGFDGPWTNAPTTCSNEFYVQLLERTWTKRKWDGPEQYEDESKTLMMLPTDMAMKTDPEFRKWTELYAKDEAAWFNDFAAAFGKMQELGVAFPAGVCPVMRNVPAVSQPAKPEAAPAKKKGWFGLW